MEDGESCCAGRSRGVPGSALVLLVLGRIGTAEGPSLDWLGLGMMHPEGNPIGEKSEKNGAYLGMRAGEFDLRPNQISEGREEMMVWSVSGQCMSVQGETEAKEEWPEFSPVFPDTCSCPAPQTSSAPLFSLSLSSRRGTGVPWATWGVRGGYPKPSRIFLTSVRPKKFWRKK